MLERRLQGWSPAFSAALGSDEDGGERLRFGEVGSQVSGSVAWQGSWSPWMRRMSAGSEGFGSQLRKKFPFWLGWNRQW
jgi:hypothetical protein